MDDATQTTTEPDNQTPRVPVLQQLGILAVILMLIFSAQLIPEKESSTTTRQVAATPSVVATEVTQVEREAGNPFENISLEAQSAIVYDMQNDTVLFEQKADQALPLASIAKLMTTLLAYELIRADTDITITMDAIRQDGASNLKDGETFKMQDLADLTLLSSSNDGAYALAETVGNALATNDISGAEAFVAAMNIRAEELGLSETYFRNPTGLDITTEEAGAYGSARDIALLTSYIVQTYPELLEETAKPQVDVWSQTGAVHNAYNTNQYVTSIPGLIGSKTGYTDLAGGNLTVAFDTSTNNPVVAVVLGSSRSGRFSDIITLVNATYAALE